MNDILSMRYGIKLYLIFLLYNLPALALHAGSEDTLTFTINRFNNYQHQNYQERIYVRSDKNFYLSGEFLRFSIYCYEAKTRQPSGLSKVAYLELLDTSHTAVLQTKVLLEKGKGYGDVYIPSDFESGNYLLRCYTRWMRNYRADLYYQSIVQIINPFKRPGLKPRSGTDEISLQFFPESGTLVDGLPSRVAFKAVDTYGEEVDFTGSITDDLGNVIIEFSPANHGIGSFAFTPDRQRSYEVSVLLKDSSVLHPALPPIQDEGIVLAINNQDPDDLGIEIYSSNRYRSQPVLLVGQSNGKIRFSEKIDVRNGHGSAEISKRGIDPGVMLVTAFSSMGHPLADRLVFVYPQKDLSLHIDTEKKVFQNREKVIVRIKTTGENGQPAPVDLSVSVLAHHKYFDQYNQNIKAQLFINNAVGGFVEDPGFYLNGSSEKAREAMDNLMLTKEYRECLWEDIETTGEQRSYIPEFRTHIITGKLTNIRTRAPEEGIYAYLSIPSMPSGFYDTRSQQDGKLYFEVNGFTGKNEIILQTNYMKDSIYQIKIDDPFSGDYTDLRIPYFDIDESMQAFIEKASTNMQIQNAYLKYKPSSSIISPLDTSAFYHSFTRYYLDDYTRFTVMEEVFREYISGVYLRQGQDGFEFRLLDMARNMTYKDNILVLLDCVPVFDADEIIELDPLRVKKIETVRKIYYKGLMNCNGIISLSTYDRNLKGYHLNKNASVIEYNGLQPLKEYPTPDYGNPTEENNRLPDYRNVLYWDPHFKTDENGEAVVEFYTSDAVGDYEIRIEGLSDEGKPAFGNAFIQVTDNLSR